MNVRQIVDKVKGAGRSVWTFLDGKKLWIWMGVMVFKRLYPEWPMWGMVDLAAGSLGLTGQELPIDPGTLVEWGTLTVALGHKVAKAWKGDAVKPVEWTTIGEVPAVKQLPVATSAAPMPTFEMIEVKTKVAVPLGAEVTIPDGRRGIIFTLKEQTGSGLTYVVRVGK